MPMTKKRKLTAKQRAFLAARRRQQIQIPRNPSTRPIVGHGKYSLAKVASTVKARPGIGRKIGGNLGDALQDIASIFGFGAYHIRKNTLVEQMLKGTDPPSMINTHVGTIVRHREYIQDIVGSTTFTNTSFSINPGLVSTFPWLAQLASNYEEYEILGMVFEYKTLSTESINSSSTALGAVVMATEYNTINAAFLNKQQMENYEFSSSGKPSQSLMHPVECDPHQSPITKLYVRTGSVPSNADQRLYDLGNFQLATVGMQSGVVGTVIGELWCTYEIQFYKPRIVSGLGLELLTDHLPIGTGITTSAYFGTTPVLGVGSQIGCTFSTTVIQFPAFITEGSFLILIQWSGSSGSWTTPTVNATNMSIATNLWLNDSANLYTSSPSTGTSCAYAAVWKVTGSSPKLTLSSGTFVSASSGDVWITQVNSDITS